MGALGVESPHGGAICQHLVSITDEQFAPRRCRRRHITVAQSPSSRRRLCIIKPPRFAIFDFLEFGENAENRF